MKNQWYLRTQDETFGPETKERLIEWAQMGRIQPGQDISEDGETWRPATEIPFLDMRWSIDIAGPALERPTAARQQAGGGATKLRCVGGWRGGIEGGGAPRHPGHPRPP